MPPVIVLANARQFAAHERFHAPQVQSCMLLWCKAGHGEVVINGQHHVFAPDTFFLIPWNHAIGYHPRTEQPFLSPAFT